MIKAIQDIEDCGYEIAGCNIIGESVRNIPKEDYGTGGISFQLLPPKLQVKRLHENAKLPTKAYAHDAGYDLYCVEDVVIKPGQVTTIKMGIALAIPDGYVGLVWDKSSMGKRGNKVLGGVIDAGFRGELVLHLIKVDIFERDWLTFKAGSKIAQILIQKVEDFQVVEVEELPSSDRGERGWGSSGI